MSMSDCSKCWETPCICGHEYSTMQTPRLFDIYKAVNAELRKRQRPNTALRDDEARAVARQLAEFINKYFEHLPEHPPEPAFAMAFTYESRK